MRVFVLGTGRNGSMTVARSFGHATNYTAGHETLAGALGDARFDYADNHVESDNRLAWMLGHLGARFPDAFYIHLLRDPDQVAQSYAARWDQTLPRIGQRPRRFVAHLHNVWTGHQMGLSRAFGQGIILQSRRPNRLETTRFMVEVINQNIATFIAQHRSTSVSIDMFAERLPEIWAEIGAEGDIEAAIYEARVRHNSSSTSTGRAGEHKL